jgi:hypothetical protein
MAYRLNGNEGYKYTIFYKDNELVVTPFHPPKRGVATLFPRVPIGTHHLSLKRSNVNSLLK